MLSVTEHKEWWRLRFTRWSDGHWVVWIVLRQEKYMGRVVSSRGPVLIRGGKK